MKLKSNQSLKTTQINNLKVGRSKDDEKKIADDMEKAEQFYVCMILLYMSRSCHVTR